MQLSCTFAGFTRLTWATAPRQPSQTLRGIHTLDMNYCDQATITPLAISHLAGIKSLDTSYCSRAVRIASAALKEIDYESEIEDDSERL